MSITQYQTTTPATALTGFLAWLLAPTGTADEGLFCGGATAVGDLPSGTSYPAFLALVNDDLGQTWPVGDVNASPITFVDTDGACTLYLSPFSTSELPTSQAGRLGAFTLIAQLTALDPPSDCLVLGSGTVTAGAFTTWTEAAGVRRDSLSAGSGKGGDVTFFARTGAANPPGLRFHSATSQWQYSTDGTTWTPLGESGGVDSFNGRTGEVTPQSGDYTATQVGAVPTTRTITAGSGLTGGGDLSANRSLAVSFGSTVGTAAQGNDARLSDARTPTAHAASHAAGQSDAIAPSAIGAVPTSRTVTAGTGLSGGGDLSADRSLSVSYGTTAGTAAQGNDSRLSDARTPTAHAGSHAAGHSDAIAPGDIGAVPAGRTITAGTGLTGGGDLSANRSLAVSFGTAAGTAVEGNDARLSDQRTPTLHANSHAAGHADAIAPSSIGAVPTGRTISAGTGLSGGGDLSADRSLAVSYGTTGSTACVGNDSRLSDARTPTGHTGTHKHGGNDEVAVASAAANAIPKAGDGGTLADGWLSPNIPRLDAITSTFTGYLVLANGKQRTVCAASYGPPAGTFTEGDRYWDAAGAQWYRTGGATPTWLQIGIGTAVTGSGWETAAATTGYRIYEPNVGLWEYSSAATAWLGARQDLPLPSGAAGVPGSISAQTDPAFAGTFGDTSYAWLERFSVWYYTSGDYGTTKRWDLVLYAPGGGALATLSISAAAAGGARAAVAVNAQSSSFGLFVRATPVNTPPNLGLWSAGIVLREVRKAS